MPKRSAADGQQKLTRAQQEAQHLVAALPEMPLPELRALWPKYFQVPAFSQKRAILMPFLGYAIQEKAFGGLSRSARSKLEAIAKDWDEGKRPSIAPPRPTVRPGARLIRSWRGEIHEVTVLDAGFQYREQHYRSLSEIARTITGVQWSGPLFFGLKQTQDRLRKRKASS
ncbi:DUF2924 domain-containing protein [Variovorax sp. VNK109]|uniref:DUF2924 domain-containing protein n=1 Tax=Variovorax sp. VNK109 TaxID=3400919 RepID=UPI003C00DEE8